MKRPPGYRMLERARRLRREMTPQERILWHQLRDRRLNGAKCRKQMWLAGYIADFACPEARLVIEADGSQHADDLIMMSSARRLSLASAGGRCASGTTRSATIWTAFSPQSQAHCPHPPTRLRRAGPSLSPKREREERRPAPPPLPPGEREGPAMRSIVGG
jgi:hypothetical protein